MKADSNSGAHVLGFDESLVACRVAQAIGVHVDQGLSLIAQGCGPSGMSERSGGRRGVAVGVTIAVVVKVHERLRVLLWSSSRRRGRVRTVRAVSVSGHGERAIGLLAGDES